MANQFDQSRTIIGVFPHTQYVLVGPRPYRIVKIPYDDPIGFISVAYKLSKDFDYIYEVSKMVVKPSHSSNHPPIIVNFFK